MFDGLELPASADMHVHLREGAMMDVVTPTIREGGVDMVFVMVCFTLSCSTCIHLFEYSRTNSLTSPVLVAMN